MAAISLAGLGIAANILLSADDGGPGGGSRKLSTLANVADAFLEDLEKSIHNIGSEGEFDGELTAKFHKDVTRRLEEDMMDQQTLFRPPTEEEHRELYGEESAGNGNRMTDMFDGLVKTLRGGGHNNGKRDDTHKQRTLSTKEVESLHRTRELRQLSIDLGDGECQWTQPTLITETDANDVEATWLAAYPGSGKRLTVKLVEALTGHQVGDDWDHTVLLQNYGQVPMIKGQYPQHERFNWWWYSTTDQTILQLRNPRDALPSYRSMKNEIDYQTTWFNVHQHAERTYSFRTSTASWNEFLDHMSYFKLLVRQWAWQIDFYMEKGMKRVWYTGAPILGGTDGTEQMYNPRCKNAKYPNSRLECHPVALTTYEKLIDPGTGPTEMAKIASSMQNKNGFSVIGSETWPCIWSAVMDDHPNAKRNGKGPNSGEYAMNSTHLQMILNETEYIINKYSGAEWSDDTIAPEVVAVVTEYHDANVAELATVMAQEQNCAPNPCLNGGTCEEGQSAYFLYYSQRCVCPEGYTGQFCEEIIDNCVDNACLNGASCVNGINSYTCSCTSGWTGNLCQTSVDDCSNSPCLNGATCVDGHETYTCECPPGYNGANCQININECANNPCNNGGTCTDGVNGFTCSCASGWIGPTCETEDV